MNKLSFQIEYEWVPFEVNSKHLLFNEYVITGLRLEKGTCSHWGPAIYKWDGTINEGEHKGTTGILVGETDNIRQRLNQYKSGTQERGNKYWREEFLEKGTIYYWILMLQKIVVNDREQLAQMGSKFFY